MIFLNLSWYPHVGVEGWGGTGPPGQKFNVWGGGARPPRPKSYSVYV